MSGSKRLIVGISLAVSASGGCSSTERQGSKASMTYDVKRLKSPIDIDARWDKPAWRDIAAVELTRHMGERPVHFPRVQAKLAYDSDAIYTIFRVEDRYVRAVAREHQGPVCKDSCVEFFFSPSGDITDGYFNIEMNCGGTMLVHYQTQPRKGSVDIAPEDLEKIRVAHTMPKIVEPEITEPTTWVLEYSVPLDVIARYAPSARTPAPGVTWRGNLYKCADKCSHPHWLTWAPVDYPKPNFHLPQYFATLAFH